MNSKMIALLICIGFTGFASCSLENCQCRQYGTEDGCINYGNDCYWENLECIQLTDSCATTTALNCKAPSCQLLADQTTCVQVTCANVETSISTCKSYGCLPSKDPSVCVDFDTCSQITSQSVCENFLSLTSTSDTFCSWHVNSASPSQSKCVQVSGCNGLDQDVCSKLYFCQANALTNTCSDLVCKGLNQQSCSNAKSLCQWSGSTSASSSITYTCINNNCKQYSTEKNCNSKANLNFCAWNGRTCNQCDTSFSNILFSVIATLFVTVLVI